MPLYEYFCEDCQSDREEIRSFEDKDDAVSCHCGGLMERHPSAPYFRPEGMWGEVQGRRVVKNDYDDPWEGSSLQGRGKPNTLYYKSKRVQVDYGKA